MKRNLIRALLFAIGVFVIYGGVLWYGSMQVSPFGMTTALCIAAAGFSMCVTSLFGLWDREKIVNEICKTKRIQNSDSSSS